MYIYIIPQSNQHIGFTAHTCMNRHLGKEPAKDRIGSIGHHTPDHITRVEVLEIGGHTMGLEITLDLVLKE